MHAPGASSWECGTQESHSDQEYTPPERIAERGRQAPPHGGERGDRHADSCCCDVQEPDAGRDVSAAHDHDANRQRGDGGEEYPDYLN